MAFIRRGDLFWLELGIVGYFVSRLIYKQLLAIRSASQVTKGEKQAEVISQRTEDALKIDTLRELADGANQDIRYAAIKIITERVFRGPTYDLLLRDIAGKSVVRRDKGIAALQLLERSHVRESLCNYETYKALIDCLCRFLSDREAHPFSNFDTNLSTRPQAEKDATTLLRLLYRYKLGDAYRAGLVTRWLGKYPFGGQSSTETQKREVLSRLQFGQTEDIAMYDILHCVCNDPEGRKQLRNHGLVGSSIGESRDEGDDLFMLNGEDTAGRVPRGGMEEQALRRRRREAMVLHEGDQPLTTNDIIQW